MPKFQLKEQILAPPEKVFDFLLSVENAEKINAQMRKTMCLEDGEPKIGSRYHQTRNYQGREVLSEYILQDFTRPNHLHFSTEKQGIRADYRYEIKNLGSGTELSLDAEIQAEGSRSLLALLIAEIMKRRDRDLLERVEIAIIKAQAS
jgi:hypothetical protein